MRFQGGWSLNFLPSEERETGTALSGRRADGESAEEAADAEGEFAEGGKSADVARPSDTGAEPASKERESSVAEGTEEEAAEAD